MVQAVGIHVMGTGTAQLLGPLVHELHESFDGAGVVDRQNGGRIVAGLDHQTVQKIPDGHLLAHLQGHIGAAGLLVRKARLGNGDHHIQVRLHLNGHQTGHDLGQACRIELFVDILTEDQGIGAQIVEQRGLDLAGVIIGARQGLFGIQRPGAVLHAGVALEADRHGGLRLHGNGGLRGRRGFHGSGGLSHIPLGGPDRGRGTDQEHQGRQRGQQTKFFHKHHQYPLAGLVRLSKIVYNGRNGANLPEKSPKIP